MGEIEKGGQGGFGFIGSEGDHYPTLREMILGEVEKHSGGSYQPKKVEKRLERARKDEIEVSVFLKAQLADLIEQKLKKRRFDSIDVFVKTAIDIYNLLKKNVDIMKLLKRAYDISGQNNSSEAMDEASEELESSVVSAVDKYLKNKE